MPRTYTGDLVLRQVRENGRLVSAWIPRSEAREQHEDQLQEQAYRAQLAAPPPPAPPPVYSRPPTAPPVTPAPVTTAPIIPSVPSPEAPSWWINAAIQNPQTEDQRFANVANALLPTLAPEDQRNLANYLATHFKDVYGGYAGAQFDQAPTEITDPVRRKFLSPGRAQSALNLLDRMKQASGTQDMGKGYDFLRNAVGLINQFAEGGVMTRERYNQFVAAVNGLVTGAGSGLSAYGNLAQLFNLPKFSAGPLVSNTPNSKLFT
jgi:hypothetical protein